MPEVLGYWMVLSLSEVGNANPMTKQTLYSMKYKWMQRVNTMRQRVKAAPKASPISLIDLSHKIWDIGARGEEIWDMGFALQVGAEWLYLIGDQLNVVQDMSEQVYRAAELRGINACRLYVNLKCDPPQDRARG